MKKHILIIKELPFPHISFSLILDCLIISIPILFNDVLYAFLAANVGLAYPWQYLTSVFAHGPEPPLLIHLIINLLIITFCVALTERLLGSWRTFLILVVVGIVLTFIRFETYNFYNGISYFIFAYSPIAFVIYIELYKYQEKTFHAKTTHILGLFSSLAVFILYPVYFSIIDSIFCERTILHLISVIIGVLFILIWRQRFATNLKELNQGTMQKQKSNILDKMSCILGYLISVFNLLALLVLLLFLY